MVSLASTIALAHAIIIEPYVWWPFRITSGFCFAVIFMVIESWLNETASNANRGFVFSVYTIINLTVVSVGQLMLMVGDPGGFLLFTIVSILVSLAVLPVALTRATAPQPIASVKVRIRFLFRCSPVGIIGVFCVGMSSGAFWTLGPVFAQSRPDIVGTAGIALFMTAAVLAGAIGQWPLGRLSDWTDRRRVIVFACLGAVAGGAGTAFASDFFMGGHLVFAALFGVFSFPLYALCAAHMNDSIRDGGFVEASSGLLLLFATGAVLGPVVASIVAHAIGPHGLFLFTATVHAALGIFACYRMLQRPAPPEEDREPFADSMRVAQIISPIDPLQPGKDQERI